VAKQACIRHRSHSCDALTYVTFPPNGPPPAFPLSRHPGLRLALTSGGGFANEIAKIMDRRANKIAQSTKMRQIAALWEKPAVLFGLLYAVLLTGCSTEFMQNVKTAATEMTTPAPVLGPYDPPQPSPWTPQPDKPAPPSPAPAVAAAPVSTPVFTAPQGMVEKPRHFNDPKIVVVQPASVVTLAPASPPGKGASKLMTPADGSALRVNAREITPAQAPAPQTAAAQPDAAAGVAAPVGELIFKGPPRQYRSSSPVKWIVMGVVLILAAAAGGSVWFMIQRRAGIVAAVGPAKEKPPEGLEMREPTDVPDPVGHGPDTVLDA
jgi:hypothetical protein